MKKFRSHFVLGGALLARWILEFQTRGAVFVNVKKEGGYTSIFRLALK